MGSTADLTCVACDGAQAWVASLRPCCIARVARLGSQPQLVDAISWKTWVNGMAVDPGGQFHMVGRQGRYWFGSGNDWSKLTLPCGDLMDVCVDGPGEVVLCGDRGVRVHVSHAKRRFEIFDNDKLTDELLYDIIRGGRPGRFFAVGEEGTLLTHEAGRWRAEHTGHRSLLSVACDGADQLYISGRRGLLMRRDGRSWRPISTPDSWKVDGGEDIYRVTVIRGECYVAAGHGGLGKVVGDRVEMLRDKPVVRLAGDGGLIYAVGDGYVEWFDGERWHGGQPPAPDHIDVVKPKAIRPKRVR